MKKERVYISGKISGLGYSYVNLKFAACEAALNHVGMEPVNPLNNGLPESATWKEHMRADIALLKTCDTIYLQEDFAQSRGAMMELFLAMRWGKRIIMSSCTSMRIVKVSQLAPGKAPDFEYLRFPLSHPVFLIAKELMDNTTVQLIEAVRVRYLIKQSQSIYPQEIGLSNI